ncbi:MAG: hypothetical protein ACYCO3_16135 [Mycobacteriales bacterium]
MTTCIPAEALPTVSAQPTRNRRRGPNAAELAEAASAVATGPSVCPHEDHLLGATIAAEKGAVGAEKGAVGAEKGAVGAVPDPPSS